MRRAGLLIALSGLVVLVFGLRAYAGRDYRPVFARTAGELIAVRDSTSVGLGEDGKRVTDVTLVSDTGFEVRVRVRAPATPVNERHPGAILVAGYQTGRKSADIPDDIGNLVLAAVDYPYDGPKTINGFWEWAKTFPEIRDAIVETPAALLLVAQYMYSREDVDPERVSVIGVSLGVPFTAAVAATDRRLASAALLHGGADISRMVSYAYADAGPPWVVYLLANFTALLFAPLEPAKYVGEIAPRPILMVNATDDEYIHRRSAEALYARAREPKEIIWLETMHVATEDQDVVNELMQITLDWLERIGAR